MGSTAKCLRGFTSVPLGWTIGASLALSLLSACATSYDHNARLPLEVTPQNLERVLAEGGFIRAGRFSSSVSAGEYRRYSEALCVDGGCFRPEAVTELSVDDRVEVRNGLNPGQVAVAGVVGAATAPIWLLLWMHEYDYQNSGKFAPYPENGDRETLWLRGKELFVVEMQGLLERDRSNRSCVGSDSVKSLPKTFSTDKEAANWIWDNREEVVHPDCLKDALPLFADDLDKAREIEFLSFLRANASNMRCSDFASVAYENSKLRISLILAGAEREGLPEAIHVYERLAKLPVIVERAGGMEPSCSEGAQVLPLDRWSERRVYLDRLHPLNPEGFEGVSFSTQTANQTN